MDEIALCLIDEHLSAASSLRATGGELWGLSTDHLESTERPVAPLTALCGPSRQERTRHLAQTLADLIEDGIAPASTLYVDLADPRLPAPLPHGALAHIVELYFTRALVPRQEPFYLFFDNVRSAPDWLELCRALIDAYPARIWVADACAVWTAPAPNNGLPPFAQVTALKGPDTASLLRRLAAEAARVGEADPLSRALDRFYRLGRAATSPDPTPLRLLRQAAADSCAHDASRLLPSVPLALIRRTAALLLAQGGTAPSLSALQRTLAAEGTATTRATLAAIADALADAQLLCRPPLFRHAEENPRAARFVFACDHGTAQAFSPAPLAGTALLSSVVFSQLYEEGLAPSVHVARMADAAIALLWEDGRAGRQAAILHSRPRPSRRFLDEAAQLAGAYTDGRLSIVADGPGWTQPSDGGRLTATPLGEWLLERTGILS